MSIWMPTWWWAAVRTPSRSAISPSGSAGTNFKPTGPFLHSIHYTGNESTTMANTQFATYAPIIRSLTASELQGSASLTEKLLIAKDGSIEVCYAPFEFINPMAKVVIVGITPGRTQTPGNRHDHHIQGGAARRISCAFPVDSRHESLSLRPLWQRGTALPLHAGPNCTVPGQAERPTTGSHRLACRSAQHSLLRLAGCSGR